MTGEIWQQFPVLTSGTELHLTPRGGTLFTEGAPVKIPRVFAQFISRCDGQRVLREAIPGDWQSDWDDLELVTMTVTAIQSGWLALSDCPSRAPRVTGSTSAFFPPHMSIELTEACNLRCGYCYRESDSSKVGHMPTEDLLALLEKLCAAGLRSVELTGGEPTMHRDFERILDFCASNFYMVGLLSNGTRVSSKLASLLVAMGDKAMFSVSLDASTAAVHDSRRGVPGAFARTTANIAKLAALGVPIRVSMVVDQANFYDIESTLLLAKRLGATAFSYSPLLPIGRGRDCFSKEWRMDGAEVQAKETELMERYSGFLGVLSDEAVCEVEGEDGCGAGYRTFAMDPYGDVRPCATFGARELVFGNLLRQGLEEVFSHPAIFAMNRLRVPSPEFCAGCDDAGFCRYCSLRGLHASQSKADCSWLKQPALTTILPVWQPPN